MADQAEIALQFISETGPVLPVQIAKKLQTEILFAGAILSDLVSRSKLKTSKRAIGGSPVYYMPGQEALVGERLYPVLKQKEREVFDLLKEKSVVWREELDPAQRVALNDLKDFSVPIDVKLDENNVTRFWKFYLIPDTQAHESIKQIISANTPQEPVKVEAPVITEQIKEEIIIEAPVKKIEEPPKKEIPNQAFEELKTQLLKELDGKVDKPKQEVQQKIETKKEIEITGELYLSASKLFEEKEIKVISKEIIKKDKEFDFIVEIPSTIGKIKYYAKAKDKPKLNETDLSYALSEGQSKRLPTLFISNGELNKKAESFLEKHKGMISFVPLKL